MDQAGDRARMACQMIYSINALTLLTAYDNPEYEKVLSRADLTLADGIGAVWAIHRWTGKKPKRVPGIDLIFDLVRVCAEEKQGVFLLGGRPGVAARSAERLQSEFPGLHIAGIHEGYWSPADEAELIARINRSRAGLLLVGLGQPAQEFFLDKYRQVLQTRVALGVGGSFDVLAGNLQRAPRWMQHWGLEWLYRLLQEPWRISRILRLPRFVWVVMRTPRKIVTKREKGLCEK